MKSKITHDQIGLSQDGVVAVFCHLHDDAAKHGNAPTVITVGNWKLWNKSDGSTLYRITVNAMASADGKDKTIEGAEPNERLFQKIAEAIKPLRHAE